MQKDALGEQKNPTVSEEATFKFGISFLRFIEFDQGFLPF
jgi:hypothetical protein